jgi:hypothetical protein
LLGFHVGFWDYMTFVAIFVIVCGFLAAAVFILGLPGRIAIARRHPEADAVYLMGWVGFLAIVPWIQALIWAFKPTDVMNIRYLPKEENRETDAMIARLTGEAPSPQAPPGGPSNKAPRHDRSNPRHRCRLYDLLAGLLQAQAAPPHPWLGHRLRLFRAPPLPGVPHWSAVRDAQLSKRHDGSTHHPAHPAFARADPGHRGIGRRKCFGEEGPAVVPVRPSALSIQGRADRSTPRGGSAKRPRAPGGRQGGDAKGEKSRGRISYELYQKTIFDKLAREQAVREEDVVQRNTRVNSAQATTNEALAELERARLKYKSEIDGINTTVANMAAQLQLARYYLDNTTLVAPEDGRIINLQVRPGMVSGIYRIGGIAALIADHDRYLLATFYQENLKYVRPGQPVEVSFDLYPGQIFAGRVDSIWRASGAGQYLPSDEIPKFQQPPPTVPQGQYAVKIFLDDPDQSKFPIGAQGTAAIYTSGEHGAWAALRKISIRAHSWLNWLYPINF